MSKPIKFPEWATGGGAHVVEPVLGDKQLGHQTGHRTPAGFQNWWQKLSYDWLVWLDASQFRKEQQQADILSGGHLVADLPTPMSSPGVAVWNRQSWAAANGPAGPVSVIAVCDADVLYVSEDGGFSWTDWESGSASHRAAAFRGIGSGYYLLSIAAAGKWRTVFRTDTDAVASSSSGTIGGAPDLYRVVWDDVNGLFWAVGPGGIWQTTNPAASWTQVSAVAHYKDVCVLPSGRVLFTYATGATFELHHSDDAGATPPVFGLTHTVAGPAQISYDVEAAVAVISDPSADTVMTTVDGTAAADTFQYVGAGFQVVPWQGRSVVVIQWKATTPATDNFTAYVRRGSAWSHAFTDPAHFYAVPVPSGFLQERAVGVSQFVALDPRDSSRLLVSRVLPAI